MAPTSVKKYTLLGNWSGARLELQHDGLPFLWINSNCKYGPWAEPYITIHSDAPNGEILAAAKMAWPGWDRNFRMFLGNPDCTDLKTWPVVSCQGTWASEYRFCVEGREFAWRRTRDRNLGALRKGRRDYKLVAFESTGRKEEGSLETSARTASELQYHALTEEDSMRRHSASARPKTLYYDEKIVVDIEEEEDSLKDGLDPEGDMDEEEFNDDLPPLPGTHERVIAVYINDARTSTATKKARINFFEKLPTRTELWCLAAVFGLQEKITRNKQAFALSSFSYGASLRYIGNFI